MQRDDRVPDGETIVMSDGVFTGNGDGMRVLGSMVIGADTTRFGELSHVDAEEMGPPTGWIRFGDNELMAYWLHEPLPHLSEAWPAPAPGDAPSDVGVGK